MVKKLDDNFDEALIEHVGWRLWRLARLWKAEFDAEMVRLGHGWMTEARGAVVGHLRPGGLSQSALTSAMGISKQAVQQLVDELVADGIVERVPDEADGRGKIVRMTRKGMRSFADGNAVKRAIEQRYAEKIGVGKLAELQKSLDRLAAD
ncbi:MAG: MarR family transcriptional regulator [Devosia sp.]